MLNRFAPNKKFLKWHMDEKLNHRFLMIEFLLPKGCVKYSVDFHIRNKVLSLFFLFASIFLY